MSETATTELTATDQFYIQMCSRLLDPTPLSEYELDAHLRQGSVEEPMFFNFHHPLHIGTHKELTEEEMGHMGEHGHALRDSLNARTVMDRKHRLLHEDGNPAKRIHIFERPYRPYAAFVLIRRGLHLHDSAALAEFIIDLWTDTESAQTAVWKDLLRAMPMGNWGDTDLLDPSGTTTVYRGIRAESEEDIHDSNPSWTTDREKAVWFAERFYSERSPLKPFLLTGTVDNSLVLFSTDGRGESEVVSNAVHVTRVERA